MKLDHRFYRLPIKVDVQRIQHEINNINESEWIDHPDRFVGNSTLPLVSVNGEDNHSFNGQMMLCPRTAGMPYLKQVLSSLNTPIGRSRLMRLSHGACVPPHYDIKLYWQQRMRVHIPIVTNDTVMFESGGQVQHMAAGEIWILDTWRKHSVINNGAERIHLVIDTRGGPEFWQMLNDHAWKPTSDNQSPEKHFVIKPVSEIESGPLMLEEPSDEVILRPSKIEQLLESYLEDLNIDEGSIEFKNTQEILCALVQNWQKIWDKFGVQPQYYLSYRLVLLHAIEKLRADTSQVYLKTNKQKLSVLLEQIVNQINAPEFEIKQKEQKDSIQIIQKKKTSLALDFKPLFIVAAPRSGSTLLYETLGSHDQLKHYDAESHQVIESIPSLSVDANGSNELYAKHATKVVSQQLRENFLDSLSQEQGSLNSSIHFLEKTPKNALRIKFLKTAFPNARFIYLYRQPRSNISSIIDGWKSGRFVTYPDLKEWRSDYKWSFLLPSGWQSLPVNDIAAIAAYQYKMANHAIIQNLIEPNNIDSMAVSYEDFVSGPSAGLQSICSFLDLPWSEKFNQKINTPQGLALSKYTLTPPKEGKWLKNQDIIAPVIEEVERFYDSEMLPAIQLINS